MYCAWCIMALLRLTTWDNTALNKGETKCKNTHFGALMENAKIWATANGFDRLRVIKFDFEKPSFVGTITTD